MSLSAPLAHPAVTAADVSGLGSGVPPIDTCHRPEVPPPLSDVGIEQGCAGGVLKVLEQDVEPGSGARHLDGGSEGVADSDDDRNGNTVVVGAAAGGHARRGGNGAAHVEGGDERTGGIGGFTEVDLLHGDLQTGEQRLGVVAVLCLLGGVVEGHCTDDGGGRAYSTKR